MSGRFEGYPENGGCSQARWGGVVAVYEEFEHDQLMYAQGEAAGREDGLRAGRLAEMKNTEREKKRADIAQESD